MSTIPLDDPTTGSDGPPSIKLATEGAHVTVGIVNTGQYQQKKYSPSGDGELQWWEPGKPKMGTIVTGLVTETDGCHTGPQTDPQPVTVGEIVSFFIEGTRWFPFRDGLKDFKDKGGALAVGVVMRWDRGTDKPTNGGFPQKTYTVRFRNPEARDGDLVDRCVTAHNELTAPPLDEPAGVAGSHPTDEEPF